MKLTRLLNSSSHTSFNIKCDRGLGVLEFEGLPFEPQRIFWISSQEVGEQRGNHAHKTCSQILICLQGHVRVRTFDKECRIYDLYPFSSLLLEPLTWSEQVYTTENDLLLVVCSEPYNKDEIITSFDNFKELTKFMDKINE